MAASSKPGGDLMRDGDQRWTDEATTPPSGSPLASTPCSAGARSDQASCSHRPHPGRSARALLIFCAAMAKKLAIRRFPQFFSPTSGGLFQPSGALMQSQWWQCASNRNRAVHRVPPLQRSRPTAQHWSATIPVLLGRTTRLTTLLHRKHRGRLGGRYAKNVTICPTQACITPGGLAQRPHLGSSTLEAAHGGFGGSPGFSQLINRTVRGPTSWGLVFK